MKTKPIPAAGLEGQALAAIMREAAENDYRQIIDLVRGALMKKLYPLSNDMWLVEIAAIYPDRVITCKDGKQYQLPYSIDDKNQVTLGDPVEVTETYVPVLPVREDVHEDATFMEAVEDASSGKWQIRVIKSGLSLNNVFYSDAVLREAVPLLVGARVFLKADQEHLKGEGKDVDNLIGSLSDPKFIEGKKPDTGEIQAVFQLIEPEGPVAVKIREAHKRKMSNLFGFSIDADGKAKTQLREGVKVKVAASLTKVHSVDLIVEPGAGGRLIRMIESVNHQEQSDMKLREKMLATIKEKSPKAFAAIDPATIEDDALEAAYREAVGTVDQPDNTNNKDDVREQIRMIEARADMRIEVSKSSLPAAAQDKLIADFAARESFKAEDVTAAIKGEKEYLARFTEAGKPVIHFDEGAHAEDRSVKVADMLDAFFDPAHADHRNVHSFKECYIEITGDNRVTGRIENCDRSRLREAVGATFRESLDSTSFANVLGNSLTRRMVAEYNGAVDFQGWRKIVTTTPVNDFRSQERTRYGGYGDLPSVAEKDPYAALSSPTDEKATYSITKRGGTEDITLEMIKNDDVGSIQRIPQKLGRAAQRTLAKFVFDFYRLNPNIYDGIALFHATHGNLQTAALDATALSVQRLAMLKQTELSSADRLGIGPKYMLVPLDLQETSVNLFNRNTNLDETFIQAVNLEIIPVWYWTDVTDWALSADPRDIPTIEIGFLDGREEPELFVQDGPSVGSMFSNDTLTYKLRHIYGGNVLDYRGMTKNVVAG